MINDQHSQKLLNYYIIHHLMRLIFRSSRYFGLDHSNLAKPITTQGIRNFSIKQGNPIDGYMTPNQNARKHIVIMIHQWWGLNHSICKTADLFANNGSFRVFVPDFYRGKPAINAQQAQHKSKQLNWSNALNDIYNMGQFFTGKKYKVSIMGFCMGGALALQALGSFPAFHAGASFYGIPNLDNLKVQNIRGNVIAHFGSEDPLKGFSDVETANKLAQIAKAKNLTNIKVKIYPGLSHAFCNQDSKYFNSQGRNQAFEVTRKIFQ